MVRRFKRHNEEYLKIKKTVEQEVNQFLLGVKELLSLAFYSLMESMRKDPNKYSALIHYNNNMVPAVTDYPVSYSVDYLAMDCKNSNNIRHTTLFLKHTKQCY
jgi:hypothetical protein